MTKPSADRPWGVVFLLAGLPATFSAMVLPFNPIAALPWVIVSWPVTAYAGYRIWRASHPTKPASTAIATRIRVVPPSASSSRSGEIADALQAFLDDPDGREFVIFEDPDGFYVQFAMSASDASSLYGEVVANAYLPKDRQLDAGRDADRQSALLTLGWNGPPSSSGNSSATWNAPIHIDRVVTFVEATARIFGVDPGLLWASFGSEPPLVDQRADRDRTSSLPPITARLLARILLVAGLALLIAYGLWDGWYQQPSFQAWILTAVSAAIAVSSFWKLKYTNDVFPTLDGHMPHRWWAVVGVFWTVATFVPLAMALGILGIPWLAAS